VIENEVESLIKITMMFYKSIDFQDRMRLSKTKKITLMSIIERDAQFLALNNFLYLLIPL
jgi:hypothetical protein